MSAHPTSDPSADQTAHPSDRPAVAVLGGTGAEGGALALRLAAAGYPVVIGSRDAERGARAAAELAERLAGRPEAVVPRGTDNLRAARDGEIVVLSVPYAAQRPTLEAVRDALAGKVLVNVVVPLTPPVTRVALPKAGSAAAEAQAYLGEDVDVVAAFQNVSASKLDDLTADVGCDVLVCGDDAAAKQATLELVAAVGARGFDAGPLVNAGVVDGLTSILIHINQQHRVRSAGVRITNVPEAVDRG